MSRRIIGFVKYGIPGFHGFVIFSAVLCNVKTEVEYSRPISHAGIHKHMALTAENSMSIRYTWHASNDIYFRNTLSTNAAQNSQEGGI